ncbi:MAG: ABC transporter permease [Deltaproteobacteria bacterium]|nr:ABC transporter permease [Deltaproteobacteria bacterium]
MLQYIIRRTLLALFMIFCVGTIIFFLIHLIPGDPVDVILSGVGSGSSATPEQYEAMRATLGLDKPLYEQYLRWLFRFLRGDLGTSPLSGRKVAPDIIRQLPRTLELIAGALIIAVLVGLPAGVIAAVKSNTRYDLAVTTLSLVGLSLPNFVVGTMLILLFGLYLEWIPLGGYIAFSENPSEHLKLLFFPSFALGLALAAIIMRMTRSSLLEVLRQDYIRTARAKGLSEFVINYHEALRNALIPVVTITGVQVGTLLGGTVVVEYVFGWPGLSTLLIQGVWHRNYPMVQGVVMLMSGGFIFINLIVDIINAYLDPRIRYQ